MADVDMSLGEHIDELRIRIIKSICILVGFSILAFTQIDYITAIIFAPLDSDFWLNELMHINQSLPEIINLKLSGQFNMHIKTAFFSGFVISVPFILWQIWGFIRPAVEGNVERRGGLLVLQVSLLFFVGLSFGYFLIAPLAVNFLLNYSLSDNIANFITVDSYLSTVINISLAAAFVFQLPHIVYVLAQIRLLTSAMMRRNRKYALVAIFIISAIITPPDIFSQILIAIPFYLLYEYSIKIVKRIEDSNC